MFKKEKVEQLEKEKDKRREGEKKGREGERERGGETRENGTLVAGTNLHLSRLDSLYLYSVMAS